ncbi:amino acid adenylation domain-containing protein [Streptomyces sp. NBC_00485]|uniref:amino acid adenylation domain-containing protein n=1 Tax=unclassified Streptomyces TaxID=2593676 RepID=UPI002E194626
MAQFKSVAAAVDRAIAAADERAVAVSAAGCPDLTWGELGRAACSVAAALAADGIGPGALVPVLVTRSGLMAASWLGVLSAGVAYVPLALDTPHERLGHAMRQIKPRAVIADAAGEALLQTAGIRVRVRRVEELVSAGTDAAEHARPSAAEDPAVLIYTSGTTGRPKGVLIPHRGLVTGAQWWAGDTGLTPEDVVLCTWGTGFDGATFDTFRTLTAGARLVYASDDQRRDPAALADLLGDPSGPTVTSMTPSVLRSILGQPSTEPRPRLRRLETAGEALSQALVDAVGDRWGLPVHNLYGPAEASCLVSSEVVKAGSEQPVTIGREITGTRIHIHDPAGHAVPDGEPGEVVVCGPGIALGYFDDLDATAAAFLPDTYGDSPGGLMYRTGDRGRRNPDGTISLLGRMDQQLKILGVRTEPAEIAAVLERMDGVDAAIVRAEGDPVRLVCYLVLAQNDAGAGATAQTLTTELRRWMPPTAVPAEFRRIPYLPRTPNDKVDLAALPGLTTGTLPLHDGRDALTAVEHQVAGIIEGVLREAAPDARVPAATEFGPGTDFFALGGHSLLATRVLARVEAAFGVEIPLKDFLTRPTVRGLADLLKASRAAQGLQPTETPQEGEVADHIQRRLWLIDGIPGLRNAYITPYLFQVHGDLAPEILRTALDHVLAGPPGLRSRFVLEPARRALLRYDDGPSPEVVLDRLTDEDIEPRLLAFCTAPFDLGRGPLARGLVLASGRRTVVAVTAHHIAADGRSMEIILDRFGDAVEAVAAGRPPAPFEARRVPAPVAIVDPPYLAALEGAPVDVEIPGRLPRPDRQPVAAQRYVDHIGLEQAEAFRRVVAAAGCSTFMGAAAALAVSLARRTDQRDFLFAFPWYGRDHSQSRDAIGMFVNTLLLRVDLRDAPVWYQLLERVRESATRAYQAADSPFDEVAAALHPGRDLTRPPVTPVCLRAQPLVLPLPRLGVPVAAFPIPPQALTCKYEVELGIDDQGPDIALELTYADEILETASAEALLRGFRAAVHHMTSHPEAVVLSDPADELATRIGQTWAELLDEADITLDKRFFDAGGDSLLLMLLRERLSDLLGIEVEAAALFQHNTIRSQAAYLSTLRSGRVVE